VAGECGTRKAAAKDSHALLESGNAAPHNSLKSFESIVRTAGFHPFTALSRRLVPPGGTEG
jgi:hypothetical protein